MLCVLSLFSRSDVDEDPEAKAERRAACKAAKKVSQAIINLLVQTVVALSGLCEWLPFVVAACPCPPPAHRLPAGPRFASFAQPELIEHTPLCRLIFIRADFWLRPSCQMLCR